MWVNRNGNWYDVTNWSLKDGFSLVSFENVWYKMLKIAFKFPPQFESIESGKFDWELKEFGYKDFEGESRKILKNSFFNNFFEQFYFFFLKFFERPSRLGISILRRHFLPRVC